MIGDDRLRDVSRPRDEEDAMLGLSLVPGIGPGRIRTLLAHFGAATNVFRAPRSAFRIPGIGNTLVNAIRDFDEWPRVDQQLKVAASVDATPIMAGSALYPDLLSEIFDPPAVLWIKGDPQILNQPAVAIVGTRRASDYGKRVAFELAHDLASAGLTIVSGLAFGIDIEAHRGALDAGGRTIAVLGSGVDIIYPSQHHRISEAIAENGAVVSEFPPGTEPEAPHFPRRNRIVSGLSLGTIVVEAHERGGALITARLALEQNREVFAVPTALDRLNVSGTNRLIRDGHARLIESAEDVLQDLGFSSDTVRADQQPSEPDLEGVEKTLYDALSRDPLHIDRICHSTNLDSSTALVYLLNLEFKGLVRQMAGKQFFRS